MLFNFCQTFVACPLQINVLNQFLLLELAHSILHIILSPHSPKTWMLAWLLIVNRLQCESWVKAVRHQSCPDPEHRESRHGWMDVPKGSFSPQSVGDVSAPRIVFDWSQQGLCKSCSFVLSEFWIYLHFEGLDSYNSFISAKENFFLKFLFPSVVV